MIDQLELTNELASLMAKKHRNHLQYNANRKRARKLRRQVVSQLNLTTSYFNQFGWPENAVLERVDILSPINATREVKLLLIAGDGLTLPLGDVPQTGIYLGDDGSVYQVNYWMWSEPSLKSLPFIRMPFEYQSVSELESILSGLRTAIKATAVSFTAS